MGSPYVSEWMACAIVVLLSVCVNLSVLSFLITHNEAVALLFSLVNCI